MKSSRVYVLWLVLGMSVMACDQEPTTQMDSEAKAPGLEYVLSWDSSDIEVAEQGWVVESDLGYRVHLKRGYLVTYSLTLVPCEMSMSSIMRGLRRWLIPVAWAGHGDIADQSATPFSVAESLTDLADYRISIDDLDPSRYCDAFILFARGDVDTENVPQEQTLDGVTFLIEGSWTNADGAEGEFQLVSEIARGELQSTMPEQGTRIMDEPLVVEPATNHVITFTRSADTLFNGLDFATQTDRTMARRLLLNLTAGTQVSVD